MSKKWLRNFFDGLRPPAGNSRQAVDFDENFSLGQGNKSSQKSAYLPSFCGYYPCFPKRYNILAAPRRGRYGRNRE